MIKDVIRSNFKYDKSDLVYSNSLSNMSQIYTGYPGRYDIINGIN